MARGEGKAEGLRAGTNIKELTLRGIILGALITVIFTAANVYLGLKIGITFATSIPAAVRADQWDGLREEVATVYASDGGGAHRSHVESPRGVTLSRAAVATTTGDVSGE